MASVNLETARLNIKGINHRLLDNGYNIRVAFETGNEADPTDPTIKGKARMKVMDENGCILQWLSPWLSYKGMRLWTTAYSLGLGTGLFKD